MTDKKYEFTGKMPQKIKAAWLKALRSGEYKQAKGTLENEQGNCCLGVLCRVLNLESRKEAGNESTVFIHPESGKGFDCAYLPEVLLEKVGLTDTDQHILAGMNDGDDGDYGNEQKSFKTIARIIERNIPVQRNRA